MARRWPALAAAFAVTKLAGFAVIEPQAASGAVAPQGRTAASAVASSRAGRPVSDTEIADAIRRSGLTHEALRTRLQEGGYDPDLANPFFAGTTSGNSAARAANGLPATDAPQSAAEAFQALGIIAAGPADSDGPATPGRLPVASARRAPDPSLAVFGKDVFHNAATAFDPVAAGPVDPSFRLGVGDQLQLVLTGDTEKAYQLAVRRDGSLLVPDLGQIHVGGLTMDAARALLRDRAGGSYSGIKTGTTRLDLSVIRVRANGLFVIGEVENPGAISVSALSTAFHAVARAGGPNARGSFRNIEIRRGGTVVRRLDLYSYLLEGDASSDLRTEHGDVIYVPLAQRRVRVAGAVRRPGIFELNANEGFGALMRFVGGVLPSAALDRIQIDRVLPPDQRAPGMERALIDVYTNGSLEGIAGTPLHDGDVISVFSVGAIRRNAVTVQGEVVQPGTYEFSDDLTLEELLGRAQGLLPWAMGDRVKVLRSIPATGQREEISVDLQTAEGRGFRLREFDRITVLDRRIPSGTLSVGGAVWRPGNPAHAERQTLRDIIDVAGLRPEAAVIVVSRKRLGPTYSDTTSQTFRFEVDAGGEWERAAAAFPMHYDDNVYVLSSPGVRDQRFVTVSGLFAFPGTYAVNEGVDRVRDVVTRAGMPLPSAHAGNFRIVRDSLPLAVDFRKAMQGDRYHNVLLRAGDQLIIGPDPATVMVTGQVGRTVLVLHRPGMSLREYVELAGGPLLTADLRRATVEDIAGTVARSRRVLFFRVDPDVPPGARITVPARPERQGNVQQVVNSTLQYASLLASLAITYVALTK